MEVRAWHPVCSLYWWGPPGTESFITFLDSQLPIGEVTWEHSSVSRILSTSQQHKSFIWNSSEIIEHFSLMIYTLLFSWLSAFFVKKKKKNCARNPCPTQTATTGSYYRTCGGWRLPSQMFKREQRNFKICSSSPQELWCQPPRLKDLRPCLLNCKGSVQDFSRIEESWWACSYSGKQM